MSYKYYWEDFYPGQVLEAGGASLSAEEIIEFGKKYDPQPFHIDEEQAKQSVFGGLIASGWQTASLCMRLICDLYLLEAASLGSPGIDELRWVKPVRPGDTLSGRMTVLESIPSRSKPDRGMVRSLMELRNQHGEVVLTVKGLSLQGRRPA